MCKHCRHKDISVAIKALNQRLDLNDVFGGNIKKCLTAVSAEISKKKRQRGQMARSGAETYLIDAEISALSFGSHVLHKSLRQWRAGQRPWLNGYPWKGRSGGDGFKGAILI